ncbi:hypothetical protein SMALA_6126 [Streptomyces malaysiensis subsp. malaysiensis]|nr:hypothetical protein SMALA_6126 [Streptomyces malaysiensis]
MGEDTSTAATAAATPPEPVLTVGPLTIAPARHEVSMHGRPVDCNARGHLLREGTSWAGPGPRPGVLDGPGYECGSRPFAGGRPGGCGSRPADGRDRVLTRSAHSRQRMGARHARAPPMRDGSCPCATGPHLSGGAPVYGSRPSAGPPGCGAAYGSLPAESRPCAGPDQRGAPGCVASCTRRARLRSAPVCGSHASSGHVHVRIPSRPQALTGGARLCAILPRCRGPPIPAARCAPHW